MQVFNLNDEEFYVTLHFVPPICIKISKLKKLKYCDTEQFFEDWLAIKTIVSLNWGDLEARVYR